MIAPKPKKRTRKGLVRELDKVFAEYIRKRDKKCVICGTDKQLTCGHLFRRVAYSTRWDPKNAWGQCLQENLRHEYDPFPFHEWFIRTQGLEEWEMLHHRYATIQKWTDRDLQEAIDKFTKLLGELNGIPED